MLIGCSLSGPTTRHLLVTKHMLKQRKHTLIAGGGGRVVQPEVNFRRKWPAYPGPQQLSAKFLLSTAGGNFRKNFRESLINPNTEMRPTLGPTDAPTGGEEGQALDQEGLGECEWRDTCGSDVPPLDVVESLTWIERRVSLSTGHGLDDMHWRVYGSRGWGRGGTVRARGRRPRSVSVTDR